MTHLHHLVLVEIEPGNGLLVLDQADDVPSVRVEDAVDLLFVRGILLDQDPAGMRPERDMAPLVHENQPEALSQCREGVPASGRVDDDLVRGHRQDALDECVIRRREATKARSISASTPPIVASISRPP